MAFLSGWTYRKKITIDSTKVDSTLTDFPVLVKLTDADIDFSKVAANGADIRFTSDDELTLLNFDRESHNIETVYELDTVEYSQIWGGTFADTNTSISVNAADDSEATFWNSTDTVGDHWWKLEFMSQNERTIRKVRFKPYFNGWGNTVKDFTIEGSNNDVDWDVLYTGQHPNTSDWMTCEFSNSTPYAFYRIYMTNAWTNPAHYLVGIFEVEMFEAGSISYTNLLTGGTASASDESSGLASYAVDGIIGDNNSWATAYVPGTGTGWWKYDLGAGNEKIANPYRIHPDNGFTGTQVAPKDFTFEGSNNDVDWDILDTVTAAIYRSEKATDFTNFSEGRNSTAYRYYRVNVTATENNTRVAIDEMYIYEESSYDTEVGYYWVKVPTVSSTIDTDFYVYYGNPTAVDIIDITDLTTPADVATKAFSDSELNASHLNDSAFDDNLDGVNNRWAADGSAFPHWIGWDFGSGNEEIINSYSMLSRNDGSWLEIPNDWIVQGSNDSTNGTDGTWDDLDTRVSETFLKNVKRTFAFQTESTTAYRWYRIRTTSNQGAGNSNTSLTEVEFMAAITLPQDTWDTNHKGVWHLNEIGEGNLAEYKDATINASDGIGGDGTIGFVPTQVDGPIAKGQSFDGAGDFIHLQDRSDLEVGSQDFTFSCKFTPTASGSYTFLGRYTSSGSYFYFSTEGQSIRFRDYGGGGNFLGVAWSYTPGVTYDIEATINSGVVSVYVDGVFIYSPGTLSPGLLDRTDGWRFGQFYTGSYNMNGIMDEIRMSIGIDRGQAWRDARIDSDNLALVTFDVEELDVDTIILSDIDSDIRATHSEALVDMDTDIRVVSEVVSDINTDIRGAYEDTLIDIDTDIRIVSELFNDLDLDIRATHSEALVDIDSDIRAVLPITLDIDTDIRAKHTEILEDINTDIRVDAADTLIDINSDIRVTGDTLIDINTDIRAFSRRFRNITCDIRASYGIPPSAVKINSVGLEEGEFLCSNDVVILMDVDNAISMQFKNENESNYSTIEPFSNRKEFTLSSGDGSKEIFIKFIDIEGKYTETSIEATVYSGTPNSVTIEAFTDETATVPILDGIYQNTKSPFFRWRIPSNILPYAGFSYAMDVTPNDNINISISDTIETGLEVSKAVPFPEMTLDIASGTFYSLGTRLEFLGGTVLLSNGGAQDRIDLIYLDIYENVIKVLEGDEAASPIAPDLIIPSTAILAEVTVPAGVNLIANTLLEDVRELYININNFSGFNLNYGLHTFNVKAITNCGAVSNIATFNLSISNTSPNMGEITGYENASKIIEISSNTYQTFTSSIYLEWLASPNEPGPISYYYTTDGSEPTLSSPATSSTNLSLGPLPVGITTINIKPFDDISGNSGKTVNFTFNYGTTSSTGDTLVICNGQTLKQSLKQIQVKSILFNFDVARTCQIYQAVDFDANLPFNLNDNLTVVHDGATLFSGKIKRIGRAITSSGEGITYTCAGPRGLLTEEYAVQPLANGSDTASLVFEDIPIGTAITSVTSQFPAIIKRVQSLPTGANIFNSYAASTAEQVLKNLYLNTEFGWYIKPDGSLVSVNKNLINPNQAKFGIYGTTVNSISPQYNVMSSNLQFDVTKRYNKVIIEGALRQEFRRVSGKCIAGSQQYNYSGEPIPWTPGDYTKYGINSEFKAVAILSTNVNFARAKAWQNIGLGLGKTNPILLTDWEVCNDNHVTHYQIVKTPTDDDPSKTRLDVTSRDIGNGSLGENNTISFGEYVCYDWWPSVGAYPRNNFFSIPSGAKLTRYCASVSAEVLVETYPLTVTVSSSGTADAYGSKTLRIVDTNFKYSEDPENPIDESARMIALANEKLESYKDVKVNGTIELDTIDTTWTLESSVNLVNTQQGSWESLNAKVIGITYNFDSNTTTLELTTEFLK